MKKAPSRRGFFFLEQFSLSPKPRIRPKHAQRGRVLTQFIERARVAVESATRDSSPRRSGSSTTAPRPPGRQRDDDRRRQGQARSDLGSEVCRPITQHHPRRGRRLDL